MIAMIKRNLANALIAGAILIGLAYFGATEALGAHPFWAVKIGYIGVVVGILIYSFLWVWQSNWMPKFLLIVVLIAICAALTYFGKARFAASFAEDALAGRLWYFGWIAVVGLMFSLLMHILSALRGE